MRYIIVITAIMGIMFAMAQATEILPKELSELVAESDYILVGKVVRVDMIDDNGNQVTEDIARTGPGLTNELRLHVLIDRKGILKTNGKTIPDILVIPLWKLWHYTLGQWKDAEGKIFIFLLKGNNFQRVYPGLFMRQLSEKAEIEKILMKEK